MSTPNVTPIALGALIGLGLGCAGAKPKPDVWYDACCKSCTADACEDCNPAKSECGDATQAECMVHNDMMMCRPAPETRH
jgi:hypothetical protein